MKKPKIISKKVIYKSGLSEVISAKVRLPNSKVVEWDYFANADVVAILPLDKQGNVYLCQEWRPAFRKDLIQVPAGHCLGRSEKARLQQVHNELREETGMDAKKVTKLISYAPSARIKYLLHLYLAQDLFPSQKSPDEDEFIKVLKMSFNRAYQMFVEDDKLTTGSTKMALIMCKDLI